MAQPNSPTSHPAEMIRFAPATTVDCRPHLRLVPDVAGETGSGVGMGFVVAAFLVALVICVAAGHVLLGVVSTVSLVHAAIRFCR